MVLFNIEMHLQVNITSVIFINEVRDNSSKEFS